MASEIVKCHIFHSKCSVFSVAEV